MGATSEVNPEKPERELVPAEITATPETPVTLNQLGDKIFDLFMTAAEKTNLIRPDGVEKTRDNKTILEIRIAATPQAYRLRDEVCEASKRAFNQHLKARDFDRVEEEVGYAQEAWQKLRREVPLSPGKLLDFQHDAAQELMELFIVAVLYPALYGDFPRVLSNIHRIPFPEDEKLGIPYESWFGGIQDATTELGKLMWDLTLEAKSPEEYAEVVEGTLVICKALFDFLMKFSTANKAVMDNTHRRFQGFHKKLQRVDRFMSESLLPLASKVHFEKLLRASRTNQ